MEDITIHYYNSFEIWRVRNNSIKLDYKRRGDAIYNAIKIAKEGQRILIFDKNDDLQYTFIVTTDI